MSENEDENVVDKGYFNQIYAHKELNSTNDLNKLNITDGIRNINSDNNTDDIDNNPALKERIPSYNSAADTNLINKKSNTANKYYTENLKNQNNSMAKILPTEGNDAIVEDIEMKDNKSDTDTKLITFDDMIDGVGQIGPYQLLILFTFTIAMLLEAMLTFLFVYTAAIPNYWCATPELNFLDLTDDNITLLAIPMDPDTKAPSACMMYAIDYTNWTTDTAVYWLNNQLYANASQISCRSGYVYDKSTFQNTLVTEWNLVCGNTLLPSLSYSMIGVGQVIGALIWGTMIDIWGRRWPYCVATVLMVTLALAGSFAPWFALYLVIQFFFGITIAAIHSVGIIVAVEITGVRIRGHLSIAVQYLWTLGYMILPGIAYAIRSWRRLQMTLALVAIGFSLPLVFIKETPRWLYANNRSEEADNILRFIAKSNRRKFPEGYTVIVPREEERGGSMRDLFRTVHVTIMTIILMIVWFASSIVYYGVSLFLPTLSGSHYLNFFLSGVIELPGYFIAQLSIAYLGRRRPLCVVMIFAGVSLLGALTVQKLSLDDPGLNLNWLILFLTMIGKMCITASWSIAICSTSELYPTLIRGRAMLTFTLSGNCGNVLAPLVSLLGVYSQLYPLCVFGCITIIAGILSLFLPETKDKDLTDSVVQSTKETKLFCLCCANDLDQKMPLLFN